MKKKVKRNRKTTKHFINESVLKHGDRFDYTKTIYVNNKAKVIITCKIHGDFEQRASSHIFGYGCHECLKENRNPFLKKRIEFQESLIKFGLETNGDKYDYSLVEYISSETPVKIICKKHGLFEQTPLTHKRGSGCPKCVGKNRTTEEFIELANEIFNNKYDYSLAKYENSASLIKIICKEHGEFETLACYHLDGSGCKKCCESKGEREIRKLLEKYNIKYKFQERFDGCKYKYKLVFDFYLEELNTLVEFNGRQHYEPVKIFGGNETFEEIKIRDQIKVKYCKSTNIRLIIIDDIKSIKNILIENNIIVE